MKNVCGHGCVGLSVAWWDCSRQEGLEASLEREALPAVFDGLSGVVDSQESVGNGFVAAERINHEGGLCCLETKWVLGGEGTGA